MNFDGPPETETKFLGYIKEQNFILVLLWEKKEPPVFFKNVYFSTGSFHTFEDGSVIVPPLAKLDHSVALRHTPRRTAQFRVAALVANPVDCIVVPALRCKQIAPVLEAESATAILDKLQRRFVPHVRKDWRPSQLPTWNDRQIR